MHDPGGPPWRLALGSHRSDVRRALRQPRPVLPARRQPGMRLLQHRPDLLPRPRLPEPDRAGRPLLRSGRRRVHRRRGMLQLHVHRERLRV